MLGIEQRLRVTQALLRRGYQPVDLPHALAAVEAAIVGSFPVIAQTEVQPPPTPTAAPQAQTRVRTQPQPKKTAAPPQPSQPEKSNAKVLASASTAPVVESEVPVPVKPGIMVNKDANIVSHRGQALSLERVQVRFLEAIAFASSQGTSLTTEEVAKTLGVPVVKVDFIATQTEKLLAQLGVDPWGLHSRDRGKTRTFWWDHQRVSLTFKQK